MSNLKISQKSPLVVSFTIKKVPNFQKEKFSFKRFSHAAVIAVVVLSSLGTTLNTVDAATGSSGTTPTIVDATGTGTVVWSNPSNAQTSNSVYATASLGSGAVSHYLKATGFGFSIPAGSAVNGVTVSVIKKASADDTSASHGGNSKDYITDNSVKLVVGGSATGTDQAGSSDWGTSNSTAIYGSTTSLWGTTLSASDVDGSGFGIVFSAKRNSGGSSASNTASVDYISISVDYTAPAVTPAANPTLAQSCGVDVALVLDNSGSIGSNLGTMKTDFNNFANTFLPATPSYFSVTYFDTSAHYTLQTMSNNITTVTGAVNSVPTASGSTNWQQGLVNAQGTFTSDGRSHLVVFASDGDPNEVGNPATATSSTAALNTAITQANTMKAAGTRIITLGIGSSVDQTNMEDISSSDAYYSTSNFSGLATALQSIATALCGGTITVTKIIDQDGNLSTTNDQTPGVGWNFNVAGSSETTDSSGKTPSVNVTSNAGPFTVTETPQAGYSFVSASCTGATGDGTPGTGTVTGITVGNNDIVSCIFYNTPNAGTLTVTKHVVGGSASAGDFTIGVSGGNATPPSFAGSESGTPVQIDGNAAYTVAEQPGGPSNYSVSYSDGCSGTMAPGGTPACTVTNTYVTPSPTQGSITVTKVVNNGHGGTADVSAFTLNVTNSSSTVAQVVSGASNNFDPDTYTISESGGPSGYQQESIMCADGSVTTTDGTVTLAAGDNATCVITNDDIAPSLVLQKNVSGGAAMASDWTLTATGDQTPTSTVLSGNGGATSDGTFQAGTYTLSEAPANGETDDLSNYTPGNWSCTGGGSFNADNSTITLGIGDSATCSITNTYTAPSTPPSTPSTTFHFIKEICPSYSDIAGNAGADQYDATGGNYTQFSNYNASSSPVFPDPYVSKPISPSEVPGSCSPASGWNFNVDDNSDMSSATQVGPTGSDGQVDVAFSGLPSNVQTALSGGNEMWVAEVQQPEVAAFGALRCYQDAVNGDNLEQVSLGSDSSSWPSDVYCIAYNVGTPSVTPTPGGGGNSNPTLTVTISNDDGDGSGTVTSTTTPDLDSQIDCTSASQPDDCSQTFASGTVVTLTATPDDGSTFTGTWSGACTGDDPVCTITVTSDTTVNAHFSLASTTNGGCVSNCGGGGGGVTPTPTPTPAPTATPTPSSGGGVISIPSFNTSNSGGQVLGTSTTASSSGLPVGQVLGASTTALPRTGMPPGLLLLIMASVAAFISKRLKLI